MKALGP